MSLSVIILAAGRGTRMGSSHPKVLQLLAGKPLLHHVLNTVDSLKPAQTIVVYGYKPEVLQEACQGFALEWALQSQQIGTGDAVRCAYPKIKNTQQVLVLYGDVPLISADTLHTMLQQTPLDAVGILTAQVVDPHGLGRIVRNKQNKIVAIVEEKDASTTEQKIKEINTGIYVLPYKYLGAWLQNLKPNNQQQEYYLTDVIGMAVESGVDVVSYTVDDELEISGINSQQQLAMVERKYQSECANKLMAQGVKLYDPARIDIRGDIVVGQDVVIDVNVVLEGDVSLGDNVRIGMNVYIKNSTIASGTHIEANSVIDSAIIGTNCTVGPFARIRPGTELKHKAKVGNFVETKNSSIGEHSKVNHLSYVGDSQIGSRVNIGAGVITCNYDGAQKHQTIIEDEVFIGSNCELIAPVTVGKGATLAAGTTLTKDAPPGGLTLNKKIMNNISDWQRPSKSQEEK